MSTHDLQHMSIHGIARLIRQDWGNVNYAAKPYLDAMADLDTVNDKYGCDSGASIVRYFLGNAQSYSKRTSKGLVEPAKVKAELNKRIKGKF